MPSLYATEKLATRERERGRERKKEIESVERCVCERITRKYVRKIHHRNCDR